MKSSILTLCIIFCALFGGISFVSATNLPVPFTIQAPDEHWREPWENACEEATLTMVNLYYQMAIPQRTIPVDQAIAEILRVFRIKNATLGTSFDENAEKITFLINNYFPFEAYTVENPTLEQIKAEIDAQRPVIGLFYGRDLHNQYFRDGGPAYHTFPISGYDDEKQEFIVQETGTRHGLDFRYSYATIMRAIHDFVPHNVQNSPKRIIFTRTMTAETRNLDADKDGLSKSEEILSGTDMFLPDTDFDGFSDGIEVKYDYSPKIAELKLPTGTLIKSKHAPSVYLLDGRSKRLILSEKAFLERGYKWENILDVSDGFLRRLSDGANIE
ncbi:MAG: hypothetical protein COV59_03480 [Candidatus Magasanikbacteria bacterium CG11_big_fil_rev_8_21_14_0_20_39_34]|uniref:Peptidase C39-like domain-containing protein n=1 Tax=Candidatus Magasanikbacteria bacterium CG11_big_fil_rev_8_21_14_0_20_39_34 TaxID=1974653 RepID=A0A2H0N5R7_9BACT|nr:MAG: hypothetical protein COV59_03480 [Candidatus Magasanikbacteria bacterium CG11_big_fil_rev_8_21_14_0_20_39_34]